jgi:hypothetical protein
MWAYYRILTPHQQKELTDRVNRLNLAININSDPKFIVKNVEKLFEDYPILKDCLKELK